MPYTLQMGSKLEIRSSAQPSRQPSILKLASLQVQGLQIQLPKQHVQFMIPFVRSRSDACNLRSAFGQSTLQSYSLKKRMLGGGSWVFFNSVRIRIPDYTPYATEGT